MTLEQLRMLKMIAEEGTLKAAGERMFKTQAAISQGVKQLEAQLGVQLFDRNGYRLVLTAYGERIYQKAKILLAQAKEIEQISHHFASGNEARITLAFEANFDLIKVLSVLEMMQNKFPNTEIIIQQEYITGTYDALERDEADVILSMADGRMLDNAALDCAPLYRGCLQNVAAPRLLQRHPNLKHVRELQHEYQIIVKDSGTGSKGLNFGVQDGQRRWYVNDLGTKKTLIMNGMGWGKLPEYMLSTDLENEQLVALDVEGTRNKIDVNYYVVKKRNHLLGPVGAELWTSLKSLTFENVER